MVILFVKPFEFLGLQFRITLILEKYCLLGNLKAFNGKTSRLVAVWPDMAKFCYFGILLPDFGHFEWASFEYGKIVNLLW